MTISPTTRAAIGRVLAVLAQRSSYAGYIGGLLAAALHLTSNQYASAVSMAVAIASFALVVIDDGTTPVEN